jgi:membrane protease YdiL (CAAX protease family)
LGPKNNAVMISPSKKIRALVWSILLASLIAAFGTFTWNALITINLRTSPTLPWAVVLMAFVLWVMWQYLGGRGWPRSTSETRRKYLRAGPLALSIFTWGFLASVLALAALVGYWIVMVELTGVGGNPTIPNYSIYPPFTVVLGLIMGSLVSPLTEEAAFRGYGQAILESIFPPLVAIGVPAILFALWHGPTQGFLWPKLLFYFMVGAAFGTTAYLTRSILPALPAHILGDLSFFFLVWPFDAARPLVWRDGANLWFWIYAGGAFLFTLLALPAFKHLKRVVARAESDRVKGGGT